MKKFIKNLMICLICLLSCSFTVNNNEEGPKLIEKNAETNTINNNLIVSFNNYSLNLSLYNYYYLNDGKYTDEYIAYTIGLPLSITITKQYDKFKLTIYSYNYNFYIIYSYLTNNQMSNLNIINIDENHELFHELIDYKFQVFNYKNEIDTTISTNTIYVNRGPTGESKETPQTLCTAFKNRKLSDEDMKNILENLKTGVSKDMITCSNIIKFIDMESFFQGCKFFLLHEEYGVFIDSVQINQYKYMNSVFIFDINKSTIIDENGFKNTYDILPLTGLEITAAKRDSNSTFWHDSGYDPSLNKVAYISNSSTLYGISDVEFQTDITDGIINKFEETYDASIYDKNDIIIFTKILARSFVLALKPTFNKLQKFFFKTSLDLKKLQWRGFHDAKVTNSEDLNIEGEFMSILHSFKEYDFDVENPETLDMVLHFFAKDSYKATVSYSKKNDNCNLNTNIKISLKQTYAHVNWEYSDEIFTCDYNL